MVKWSLISSDRGGLANAHEEAEYKERGISMLQRVIAHPGPLLNKTLTLPSPDGMPPHYTLSQKDGIVLCGKIDWLEYNATDDTINIIDFKTGKNEESSDSLQLPIYYLLVTNLQRRKVAKICYWYIERDDEPTNMTLPHLDEARKLILELALRIKDGGAVWNSRRTFLIAA